MTFKVDIFQMIHELHKAIEFYVPESRERSLALTKLDECEMWLRKAPKTKKGNEE